MGKQAEYRTVVLGVLVSMFSELFRCPETLKAHHKQLNNNEWIKVGAWNGAYRRVAYITPWDCSSKAIKRVVPYNLLKVVEQQRLQLIEDDIGNITEMIMTTQPAIKEVPVMGTVPMGTVTIRACTEPGVDGCVVHTMVCVDGSKLPFALWPLRRFIEETMLTNAKRVALHCVMFIADVAKGNPDAEALWEEIEKGKRNTPRNIKKDTGYTLSASEGASDYTRSRGSQEVPQRSLSRVSITSGGSSGASVYHDAQEDLPDDCSYATSGFTASKDTSAGVQRSSSINLSVAAGSAAAATQARHASSTASGKEARKAAGVQKQATKQVQRTAAKQQHAEEKKQRKAAQQHAKQQRTKEKKQQKAAQQQAKQTQPEKKSILGKLMSGLTCCYRTKAGSTLP